MTGREALELTHRYAPRRVRPMGLRAFGDWTLKVYGIASEGDEPGSALVEAALGAAESALPSPALSDDRYGLGFLGIHDGRDSNFRLRLLVGERESSCNTASSSRGARIPAGSGEPRPRSPSPACGISAWSRMSARPGSGMSLPATVTLTRMPISRMR